MMVYLISLKLLSVVSCLLLLLLHILSVFLCLLTATPTLYIVVPVLRYFILHLVSLFGPLYIRAQFLMNALDHPE